MRTGISAVVLLLIFVSHYSFSKNPSSRFFRQADSFFDKYVEEDQVDYKNILKDPDPLNKLVAQIAQADLKTASLRFKKAFYINAYNILLIKSVIDNFPAPYPLEEIGLFSKNKYLIAGDTLTLNEIETVKLIGEHKDVRILFVLSSASIGSVPVADFAFKPKKLNRQFKKKIKETANDFDFIRVMPRSSKILFAEAFKRVQLDFNKEDIVCLINRYREEPLPEGFSIEFYPANRKLNILNSKD